MTKLIAMMVVSLLSILPLHGGDRVVLRKNCTLPDDCFSRENCVYVIRYDYDLSGKTYRIGSGSTLRFMGGGLRNGIFVVTGDPVKIENPFGSVILRDVFFRNETSYGYQRRCVSGECRDSWFDAVDDDSLFDMILAFDGVTLTKKEYSLSRDSSSEVYPGRYRHLAKSFSIRSSAHSLIRTKGQIPIMRQNVYGMKGTYGLSIDGIGVEDVVSSYDYSDFRSSRLASKAFFGGALNNFDDRFALEIRNCSFKGVYQLMQWNCYNDCFDVRISNTSFYCGGMGIEIYNGNEFHKLCFHASNSSFRSYGEYALSLVSVDSDSVFENCQVDGIELYHKGTVRFEDCILRKYLTHSGPLLEGRVMIDGCLLQHGAQMYDSLIFSFNGFNSVDMRNSRLRILNDALLRAQDSINPVLLNIQRCKDFRIDGCTLEVEGNTKLLKDKKLVLLWGDGSEKGIKRDGLNLPSELAPFVR